MLAFDALTGPGRMRRLRPLAETAIAFWNLAAPSVRPMAQSMNALFRVDTTRGERYVPRVFQPGQHRPEDRQLEALWTHALATNHAANVPEPIATPQGHFLVTVDALSVPEPRTCMLVRRLSGKPISDIPAHYSLLGAEMARLHRHSDTFRVPTILQPHRYDQVYCFQNDTIDVMQNKNFCSCLHNAHEQNTAISLSIREWQPRGWDENLNLHNV